MCGRYANHLKHMSGWTELLGDWPGESTPGMDIAPTQNIPVVRFQSGISKSSAMRWGLVPPWSDTAKPKYATFNARAESAWQKPSFRGACANEQTCLIPASAYYEWSGEKGHKIKHSIRLEDETPLVMAGLWDHWTQEGQSLYSCTILTRTAIPLLMEIHPRMPVILNKKDALAWLKPSTDASGNSIKQQLERLQQRTHYPLSVVEPSSVAGPSFN